eukprot:1137154-Pelagomonas_calceolata.AAC.3
MPIWDGMKICWEKGNDGRRARWHGTHTFRRTAATTLTEALIDDFAQHCLDFWRARSRRGCLHLSCRNFDFCISWASTPVS